MANQTVTIPEANGTPQANRADNSTVRLQCPACKRVLRSIDSAPTGATCPDCGFSISVVNGIFRALTPETKTQFDQFIRNYQVIRTAEGWGSRTPDYYLALPFKDLTNKHSWIWHIRARTLLYMQAHVLPKIDSAGSLGCRVLDIGAGNGWLSYRLAQQGYDPIAIDLWDDDMDGLGAARHYFERLPQSFPRFQADMDHLPFDSGQFDVAIFNASFHYSSDYTKTLAEVLRCLRRPGQVIVADSPLYLHKESGQQMVEERQLAFKRQFGVHSDSIDSQDYLTPDVLRELAERLRIQWNVYKPWYGLKWALRPVKARLLRRREPAKFYLLSFTVQE